MASIILFILRLIALSIIPSFLLVIVSTNEFDKIFNVITIEGITLYNKKIFVLIVGLAITGGILPFQNFSLKNRVKSLESFYKADVIPNLKTTYDYLLKDLFQADFSQTSFRLFLPKKNLEYYLPTIIGKKIVLKYCSINGFFADEIQPVEFTVFPASESQGLIGKSYADRGISIRDGENNFEEYKDYYFRMTEYQKIVARDHKFVMTIPIIDEQSKMIGMLSVDCKKEMGLTQTPDYLSLLAFSRDIHKIYLHFHKN